MTGGARESLEGSAAFMLTNASTIDYGDGFLDFKDGFCGGISDAMRMSPTAWSPGSSSASSSVYSTTSSPHLKGKAEGPLFSGSTSRDSEKEGPPPRGSSSSLTASASLGTSSGGEATRDIFTSIDLYGSRGTTREDEGGLSSGHLAARKKAEIDREEDKIGYTYYVRGTGLEMSSTHNACLAGANCMDCFGWGPESFSAARLTCWVPPWEKCWRCAVNLVGGCAASPRIRTNAIYLGPSQRYVGSVQRESLDRDAAAGPQEDRGDAAARDDAEPQAAAGDSEAAEDEVEELGFWDVKTRFRLKFGEPTREERFRRRLRRRQRHREWLRWQHTSAMTYRSCIGRAAYRGPSDRGGGPRSSGSPHSGGGAASGSRRSPVAGPAGRGRGSSPGSGVGADDEDEEAYEYEREAFRCLLCFDDLEDSDDDELVAQGELYAPSWRGDKTEPLVPNELLEGMSPLLGGAGLGSPDAAKNTTTTTAGGRQGDGGGTTSRGAKKSEKDSASAAGESPSTSREGGAEQRPGGFLARVRGWWRERGWGRKTSGGAGAGRASNGPPCDESGDPARQPAATESGGQDDLEVGGEQGAAGGAPAGTAGTAAARGQVARHERHARLEGRLLTLRGLVCLVAMWTATIFFILLLDITIEAWCDICSKLEEKVGVRKHFLGAMRGTLDLQTYHTCCERWCGVTFRGQDMDELRSYSYYCHTILWREGSRTRVAIHVGDPVCALHFETQSMAVLGGGWRRC